MTETLLPIIIFVTIHAKSSYSFQNDRNAFPSSASFRGAIQEGVAGSSFGRILESAKTVTRQPKDNLNHLTSLASQLYYNPVSRKFAILKHENIPRESIASAVQGRSSRSSGIWDSVVNFLTDSFFDKLPRDAARNPSKRKKKRIETFDSEEYFDPVDTFLDGLDTVFGSSKKKKRHSTNQIAESQAGSPNRWNIPPRPSSYFPQTSYDFQDGVISAESSTPYQLVPETVEHTETSEPKNIVTTSNPNIPRNTESPVKTAVTTAIIKKKMAFSRPTKSPTAHQNNVRKTPQQAMKHQQPATRSPSKENPNFQRPSLTSPTVIYGKECNEGKPSPNWISQMWETRPPKEKLKTTTEAPDGWFDLFSDDDDDPEPEDQSNAPSVGWFGSFFGSEPIPSANTALPQVFSAPPPPPTTPAPPAPQTGWFDAIVNAEEDDGAYGQNSSEPPGKKRRRRSYKGFQLLRIFSDAEWKVEDLKNMQEDTQGSGLMWWSSPSMNRSADLLVPPGLLSDIKDHLNSEGMEYDVVIWDLQKAIKYENPKLTKTQRLELEKMRGHPMTWRRYHRYADILRYMEYLSLKFPKIVDLVPLGRSSEGLPIVAAKISVPGNNSRGSGDRKKWKLKSRMKPAIWIDGGMHAREWISPAVATWFLHTLVEGEEGNGADLDMLRLADWYILPVGNPDGYEHSHTNDRLWRKTRSKYSDREDNYFNSWFPWNWGNTDCIGVDPNRNWDYHWGEKGSSNDPCNDYYAGPRPFSEPETMGVSNFLMENKDQFKAYLTLHSYAQMWVMPTMHSRNQFSDKNDLLEMGKLALNALTAVSGTKYQIGSMTDLLQPITGTAHDWAKARAGIKYSYGVKMRDSYGPYGFLLPGSQIIPTAKETWEAVKTIADNL